MILLFYLVWKCLPLCDFFYLGGWIWEKKNIKTTFLVATFVWMPPLNEIKLCQTIVLWAKRFSWRDPHNQSVISICLVQILRNLFFSTFYLLRNIVISIEFKFWHTTWGEGGVKGTPFVFELTSVNQRKRSFFIKISVLKNLANSQESACLTVSFQ